MRRHEQNNLKFSYRVRFLQNWLYFIVCKLLKCPQWRGCKPKQCNNILQIKFALDVENILFSVTPVCSKRFCQRRSSCQIIRSIVEIHGTDLQSFLLFSDIKYQINCQDLRLPQIKTIYSTFRWTFFLQVSPFFDGFRAKQTWTPKIVNICDSINKSGKTFSVRNWNKQD